MTSPLGDARLWGILSGVTRPRALTEGGGTPETGPALLQLGSISFETAVLEALVERGAPQADPRAGGDAAPPALPATELVSRDAPAAAPAAGEAGSSPEAAAIGREAERTGIDPSILVALRRTENGAPGKEFGVVAVAANGLDAQARVAANTIRNTLQRFERGGGRAVDPLTGRYTDGFLRFLSARYAPVGAPNDPTGLNRNHTANLIALYRKASAQRGATES